MSRVVCRDCKWISYRGVQQPECMSPHGPVKETDSPVHGHNSYRDTVLCVDRNKDYSCSAFTSRTWRQRFGDFLLKPIECMVKAPWW